MVNIAKRTESRRALGSEPSAAEESLEHFFKSDAHRKHARYDELLEKERRAGMFWVRDIVGHKLDEATGELLYEVKWLGFGPDSNTFEPYENMHGSNDLVRAYHQKHGELEMPELVEYVGASSGDDPMGIWIRADQVVVGIRTYLPRFLWRDGLHIPVRHFTGALDQQDGIWVVTDSSHAYVVLHYASKSFCMVADNENLFASDEATRKRIKALLGCQDCHPVRYLNNYYRDVCGGAAILIGLEFGKFYNRWRKADFAAIQWPGTVSSPAHLKEEIMAKYYGDARPGPLPSCSGKKNTESRVHLHCDVCGWGTNKTNKSCLNMHMRKHL
ncbi:Hypothetical predicted protein [Olea europaea subsp. europaea]|uniref:Chromo domain-containing protein n=1 Tax=Olea europaea subsp. europaea TaxID=158383 RepID=A0A8S0QAM0_OLEEU|nr:Hypothetical predicted protein [Olea europaea subsp. europaea]